MHVASNLNLQFKTPEDADIFYQSFMPEFDTLPMKRSQWQISHSPESPCDILFDINSDDETAFRATINSVIQFAHVIEVTINLVNLH